MLSEKQLLANRQNALRSTGPRTAEGRAVSSRNAVRHGLRAENTVIAGEDPDEFNQFRQLLLDDLAPEGLMELLLADRIVAGFWKLRRAGQMETGFFEQVEVQQEDRALAAGKADIPIEVTIRKTYECPVYNKLLEREGPPSDCSSCGAESDPGVLPYSAAPALDAEAPPPIPAPDGQDLPVERAPLHLGKMIKQDMTGSNILMRFRLYENQIEASLYKALTELQKLQLVRARLWQMSLAGQSETPAGNS